MDQTSFSDARKQFYIFIMLLGLPDDIREEKPSFLQLKKMHYGRTDGPTDRPTDRRTDGQALFQSCFGAAKKGKKNHDNIELSLLLSLAFSIISGNCIPHSPLCALATILPQPLPVHLVGTSSIFLQLIHKAKYFTFPSMCLTHHSVVAHQPKTTTTNPP